MQIEYDYEKAFAAGTKRMVYVKPVLVRDLPDELQEQIDGLEQLFAVHNDEGEQLALVADRGLAFDLARQNDYRPQALL